MNARVPAEVFPPGEFLREELEARDWSQQELADILDRPPRLVVAPQHEMKFTAFPQNDSSDCGSCVDVIWTSCALPVS